MNPMIRRCLVGAGLALILAGCATPSQPTRYYRLDHRPSGVSMPEAAPGEETPPLVGIGNVELPGYLDRPQLVERGLDHSLKLHEFDQWAGSLQENILQVTRDELQRSLRRARVIAYPWSSGVRPRYELELSVGRFERQGKRVWLEARWSLFEQPQARLLLLERSAIETPLEGDDMEAVVAASAEAVRILAREMAARLSPLVEAQR